MAKKKVDIGSLTLDIFDGKEPNWCEISSKKNFNNNIEFMTEFENEIKWSYACMHQKFNGEVIRKFAHKLNWNYISEYQVLSEDIIREFKDKLNWNYISEYQVLSEDIIREFKDKVNWARICKCQVLSESFMEEFIDKMNWDIIVEYQKLPENFIMKYRDKLDIGLILKNQELSSELKEQFQNELPVTNLILKYKELTESFLDEIEKFINDNGQWKIQSGVQVPSNVKWKATNAVEDIQKDFIRKFRGIKTRINNRIRKL